MPFYRVNMRTLIYAAAFTLTFVAFNSATYGTSIKETAKFPHIVGSVQFPQTKAKIVRHTVRLQIPQESSALSQLIINVPRGLTVTNNIRVSDQSGRKINTNISVNGSTVLVAFPEPVAPGNRLEIDMNNVRISGVTNAWSYHIFANLVGIDVDIPIGVAQFRFY